MDFMGNHPTLFQVSFLEFVGAFGVEEAFGVVEVVVDFFHFLLETNTIVVLFL